MTTPQEASFDTRGVSRVTSLQTEAGKEIAPSPTLIQAVAFSQLSHIAEALEGWNSKSVIGQLTQEETRGKENTSNSLALVENKTPESLLELKETALTERRAEMFGNSITMSTYSNLASYVASLLGSLKPLSEADKEKLAQLLSKSVALESGAQKSAAALLAGDLIYSKYYASNQDIDVTLAYVQNLLKQYGREEHKSLKKLLKELKPFGSKEKLERFLGSIK